MINLLLEMIVPFTMITSLLLLLHSFLQQLLGAKYLYLLWLIVPASLIVPFIELPNWFAIMSGGQSIQNYLVTANIPESSWQVEAISFWLWIGGASLLIAYGCFTHVKLKINLNNVEKIEFSLPVLLPDNLPVYQSSEAYSPMVYGLFKAKLLLPEHFFEIYDQEQQALILEHELCHFNRNDMYWNLIALSCLTLMWFHPLAWLAFIRYRRDQEISCDHAVLARKHRTSRINYSKALLVTAETAPPLAFAQLTFNEYGDKHVMFERIKLIKANNSSSKLAKSAVIAFTVTVLSAVSYAGNNHDASLQEVKQGDSVSPVMRIEPKYPLQAAQEKIEGSVVLQFDVTPQGAVTNVTIIKANPENVFDKVSIDALVQWTYSPSKHGMHNNLVQLDFALDHNSKHEFNNLTETILVTQ